MARAASAVSNFHRIRYTTMVNARDFLAPLGSVRLWLAAGMVLLGTWAIAPLSVRAVDLAMDMLFAATDPSGLFRAISISLMAAVAFAAAVEGCKAAALFWPLGRRWDQWALLGAVFGFLQAVVILLGWLMDRSRFGPLIAPFSPMLLVAVANLIVIHWSLGRVAAAAVRQPGGPWLAVSLATVASVLMVLLPFQPLVYLMPLPARVHEAEPWIKAALPAVFAFVVWRWLPPPGEQSQRGPARLMVVAVIALLYCVVATIAASVAIFGSDRSDPLKVLVVVVGATFVAWVFFRQVLLNWMRQSS